MNKNYAEICPVCKGSGIYREYLNYSSATFTQKTCHGCNGKGWIELGGIKQNESTR